MYSSVTVWNTIWNYLLSLNGSANSLWNKGLASCGYNTTKYWMCTAFFLRFWTVVLFLGYMQYLLTNILINLHARFYIQRYVSGLVFWRLNSFFVCKGRKFEAISLFGSRQWNHLNVKCVTENPPQQGVFIWM